MIKQKILLIEENEVVGIYFSSVFWLHGYENEYDIHVAKTVEEAVNRIEDPETRPDIVFLSLVMAVQQDDGRKVTSPEAGFGILSKIKSDPRLKSIRVIIFSAHDDKEYQERAKELGAEAYLVKHMNMPQELVQFISGLKEGVHA